jgi:MFS-type transporter involved in bile tolerance (Atg22 family)
MTLDEVGAQFVHGGSGYCLGKYSGYALCYSRRLYPPKKMGVYMGIFNFFITFPQIVNGIFNGPIVHSLYNDKAIWAIVMAGVFMLLAAGSVLFVEDKDDVPSAV